LIKILFIFILFLISLDARENPFFPTKGQSDVPYTSNEDRSKQALSRATLDIPSQARLIKKVTVEFQNLDGSYETKSINLDNAIDWHLPIFISQSYSKTQVLQNTQNNIIKKDNFKKLSAIKFASFYSDKKTLKIQTDDKVIRNFLLTNPHRIVVDFKKDANLKYMSKSNKNNIFTKIRVGNHKGYYRVVIDLDGYYRYKMKTVSDGYVFNLK